MTRKLSDAQLCTFGSTFGRQYRFAVSTGNSRSTLSADIEPRWYERFNTKVRCWRRDRRDHNTRCSEYVAQELHTQLNCGTTKPSGTTPRSVTLRMPSCAKAGRNMATSVDLQNGLPREIGVFWNRQQTLHLLDKYKTAVARATQSEGSSFAQGGGRGGGRGGEVVEVATIRRRARPDTGTRSSGGTYHATSATRKAIQRHYPGSDKEMTMQNLSQVQRQRQQTQKEFKT
jgi:hypothetical protein